jgi:uncharacterized protein (DUF305 family)
VAAARPLIAVAAAAVLLLGGCGNAAGTGTPSPATTAVSPQFNAADVTFVRTLIPHHLEGVEIARIGVQRSARPETRMLAGAIVSTQTDEAARLTGWLSVWQQPTDSAAPAASGKATAAGRADTTDKAVKALRTIAAADFDKAFLDLLIAHQDAAVKLARTELGAGSNPNALAFARQVDVSRTAEIAEMRNYLG